jgi:hypothetical protein
MTQNEEQVVAKVMARSKCTAEKQQETKHDAKKQKKHMVIRTKSLFTFISSPFVVSSSGGAALNPKASNPKPNFNLPIFPPRP